MVRCADCGLLGVRHPESRDLQEADEDVRKTGSFRYLKEGLSPHLPLLRGTLPLCSAMAADLTKEIEAARESRRTDFASSVLQGERDCASFWQWHPGLLPKDHKQMQMNDQQRKFDQEQREKDRVWQEERRKEDLDWKANQERTSEERWNREHGLQRYQLVIVGVIGTIVLAIAQLVGSLIQANAAKDQPAIIINLPNQAGPKN